MLGCLHGEVTRRQAQLCRRHDPEDHQGLDTVAQIPTPAQDDHPTANSCQGPTSKKVMKYDNVAVRVQSCVCPVGTLNS